MDNIFLSGALAFLITFFSIPVIIEVAITKKLYDVPGGRKVHKTVIPTLGGLGIFAGFIVATLIGAPVSSPILQYIIASVMVIFFLGIKDDILILSVPKKFIGQLIAAGILIKFAGIQITNMYGLFGIYELPHTISFLITIFTMVVITNSFNLIDGVDGLAGSLGLMTSLIFGFYFMQTGQTLFAVMAFSLAGSLVGFLIFNYNPAKIFMGDTGSLLIGLLNAIFVVKFIAVASDPASSWHLPASPALGFAILIVPLFDTVRVVGVRIISRRSPFSPDRNHIHHYLLDMGLGHTAIILTCVAANIGFIALAYVLQFAGTTLVVLALSGMAMMIMAVVYYNRPKRLRPVAGRTLPGKPVYINAPEIFTYPKEAVKQDSSF